MSPEEKAIQSTAEQACRYMLKHQDFSGKPWESMTEYERGFKIACELCEKAIGEHVKRKHGHNEAEGGEDA